MFFSFIIYSHGVKVKNYFYKLKKFTRNLKFVCPICILKLYYNNEGGDNLADKERKLKKALYRLAEGDKNSLSEIYDITGKNIYYTAYSVLHNREDAEDAMQNTLFELIGSAGSYRGEGAVLYVLGIARNQALKILHNRKYDVPVDEAEAHTDDNGAERLTMLDALARLSETDRFIVEEHVFMKTKFKALAAELNMTDQAVQKRYVRALKAMKEYYGGK